jgi:acetyl esterase
MSLDPHAKRLLDMLVAGRSDVSRLSPDAMRQRIRKLAQAVDAKNVPVGASENREICGPRGGIPLRIYTPATTSADTLPALIYFHGGAGVFCSIETHDGVCRALTNESGCRVISVGYRLDPEHKFPAAIDDAYAATDWVFVHIAGLGIDPKRVAVGGDSAGATLAAVVCQLAWHRAAAPPVPSDRPRFELAIARHIFDRLFLRHGDVELGARTLSHRGRGNIGSAPIAVARD